MNVWFVTLNIMNSSKYIEAFHAHIQFAFAYGSGVFTQELSSKPLIDMILVSKDTADFHRDTLKQYPKHYPLLLRYLSSSMISMINDKMGAGVNFCPYISLDTSEEKISRFKYGIISEKNLMNDLNDWTTLYISGRMQKPIVILRPNEDIMKFQIQNLKMALSAALLLLPEEFSVVELYRTIIQLSYLGDIRMGIAEHPRKIDMLLQSCQNTIHFNNYRLASDYITEIINHSPDASLLDNSLYGQLYEPILKSIPELFQVKRMKNLHSDKLLLIHPIDHDMKYKESLFQSLPLHLQQRSQSHSIHHSDKTAFLYGKDFRNSLRKGKLLICS